MLSADAKTNQRIFALMQRVLIVDPQPASAKLLSGILRDICTCQIWTANEVQRALQVAQGIEPHVIFIDHGRSLDGAAFTRAIRRSDLICRRSPVIMISALATAASIIGARDSGVHEFLRKPFTIKDLVRRLEAVSARPRDWIEGIGYIGPDRRRFNSGDYSGPMKRRVDHAVTPDEAKFVQALKITRAAIAAIETDPRQALRSLVAQAAEIADSTRAKSDPTLREAALAFGRRLELANPFDLPRPDIERLAAPLLGYLEIEAEQARPAA
ncbi:MAG TPA: response regulator [Caulobacteraceae bacterium]|nr:response regulator [Caulobacteraceae bacterium]